ncbi:PepSY-associated TM helix domain-containing protein [Carboxylicivirga sediminis]|uniref:PepSY-associated TM helix domain-containing protein n=1 Tax=Carboxylicivirga sediminis TaxID=2006564 RepID=A0A941EZ87_9BACT|nr:PepSY-associated TM helix domain-containing protein [Carboxylicivirga sediminis]MBR8534321.1 PepSY-associated TM helix domain-containing protein [Carboxylicivirga sediminis]
MKWSTKVRKWLRIIHRDLGYLLAGITVIYGISGYLLNHMDGKDPAFDTTEETIQINSKLNSNALYAELQSRPDMPDLKRILPHAEGFYKVLFDGGIGVYNSHTGELSYEFHRKKPFVYAINKLHYNKVKGWTLMGDFLAFSLIFLAVSGLFMVKGKNGLRQRGVWLLAIGLTIPILYIAFT